MLPSKLQGGLMSENFIQPSRCDQVARFGKAASLFQPAIQLFNPFTGADFGRPTRRGFEFARIRNVVPLVAGTPVFEAHLWLVTADRADDFDQFLEAERISQAATDVEGLSGERVDIRLRQ